MLKYELSEGECLTIITQICIDIYTHRVTCKTVTISCRAFTENVMHTKIRCKYFTGNHTTANQSKDIHSSQNPFIASQVECY